MKKIVVILCLMLVPSLVFAQQNGRWGSYYVDAVTSAERSAVSDSLGLALLKTAFSDSFNGAVTRDALLMRDAAFPDSFTAGLDRASTAFSRSILDDADEATFKATVNLEIGADVQAYSANMDTDNTDDMLTAAFDDSLHGVINPEGMADSTYISDDRLYRWQVGGTVKFGDVVYRAADDDYEGADSDALTTMPAMAVCVTPGGGAATAYLTFMSSGWIKWPGYTNITAASDSVYAYVGTTAGSVTEVKPSGTGDIIQVIGTIHGDGLIHFKPDFTELTIE